MAVTKGQGNPDWTRDETILALNLYFELNGNIPGPKNEKVIDLSMLLNRLPIHPIKLRKNNFRNPDGVSFKLQNIRSVATGKGFDNSSKMDKIIWQDFGLKPELVKEISNLIKENLDEFREYDKLINEVFDDETFAEGEIITAVHKRRERSPGLRKKVLKIRKREGRIFCDICGCKPFLVERIEETAIFECHHILPLSESGIIDTKLSNIAFICANCHRAIHSMIIKEKRWIKPEEIRKLTTISI